MAELCEAATKEVGAADGVRIANFLCPGNYAVSGGLPGCEAVERLAKSFGARMCVRLAVAAAAQPVELHNRERLLQLLRALGLFDQQQQVALAFFCCRLFWLSFV